jgi:steroid 5-alpha reductase family enzyme
MILISALWLLSLILKDVSIVDIFWAPGFLFVALAAGWDRIGSERGALVTGLVALWAIRLGGYLWGRWRRKGHEDPRYTAMRRASPAFAYTSLVRVFWLQGALIWIISWPLQASIRSLPGDVGPLDYLGAAMALAGILIEAIADAQLTRFLADPPNQGKVMDRGVWSWSRHPNYFGNALMWWGYYVIAVSAGAWWTIFAPVIMTFFLLRVSGVSLLERTIARRRPEYEDYMRRTSAFVPLPPKRA